MSMWNTLRPWHGGNRWWTLCPILLCGMSACVTTTEYGPESPYYAYPEGMRLTLNQVLEIPPDSATVRLQFGRVAALNDVQEQEPHCIFELETVRDTVQRIEPDTFHVVRVQRSVWMSSLTPPQPVRAVRVGLGDSSSGPTLIYYQTEFRLRSERQQVVRALTCQSNQNAAGIYPNMRHLTLPEIRQALGAIFSLQLPVQRL